eukprot:CAMPEP_0179274092 /NCGR_PEP_ID=MMETSP0797-20121207/33346_1 /TAXON_ID=47934 /ORGANISM="Dinophysis acuminata, Strain DAEP01" /LENGTH=64 /DNA_ID=CAMNT_0020982531 /DNA_START=65 /DNA_END=259 /DNA_ORIENTATION=-
MGNSATAPEAGNALAETDQRSWTDKLHSGIASRIGTFVEGGGGSPEELDAAARAALLNMVACGN